MVGVATVCVMKCIQKVISYSYKAIDECCALAMYLHDLVKILRQEDGSDTSLFSTQHMHMT